jgi:hypothetical protein
VAQPGSALAWGARGRKFESCRPDQLKQILLLKEARHDAEVSQRLGLSHRRGVRRIWTIRNRCAAIRILQRLTARAVSIASLHADHGYTNLAAFFGWRVNRGSARGRLCVDEATGDGPIAAAVSATARFRTHTGARTCGCTRTRTRTCTRTRTRNSTNTRTCARACERCFR